MSALLLDILLYVNLVPPCVIGFNKVWESVYYVLVSISERYSHWIVALFYLLSGCKYI